MFDIGWSEILVLAVLAIIVVGPKDLPIMLRNIGRYTAKMRSMAREFQDGISDMARETELNDLRDLKKNLSKISPTQQVKKLVGEAIDPDEFEDMEKNQRALMEKAEAAADKFGAAPAPAETDVADKKLVEDDIAAQKADTDGKNTA
ncbi:MAG: Sec-independent protein translocase protein TatB [Parvibaculaceae bacterium]|nr:Sec-independent protein translocase protein TatB [Parvibaculaceae bacterium]